MNQQDKTKEQLLEELLASHRKAADFRSRPAELSQRTGLPRPDQDRAEATALQDVPQMRGASQMLEQEPAKHSQPEGEPSLSDTLYRTLVETAGNIIWAVDLELRYTSISPSVTRVLGYTVSEIMSMHPVDGLTPESRARVLGAYQEELALEAAAPGGTHTSRTEEMERYHKDGSTRWMELTMTFLWDSWRPKHADII